MYAMCLSVFMLVCHTSLTSLCVCKELLIAHMFSWYLEKGGISQPASPVQGLLKVNLFCASTDFNRQEETKENQERKSALDIKTGKSDELDRIAFVFVKNFFCLFVFLFATKWINVHRLFQYGALSMLSTDKSWYHQ